MCSKRFGIREENVGMAAGALIGAYNLASFVSSFMLGHLADKYGRKLIVLGGLLSGAVGTILFGFSPNFALAFASRLLAGALSLSKPNALSMSHHSTHTEQDSSTPTSPSQELCVRMLRRVRPVSSPSPTPRPASTSPEVCPGACPVL